MNPRTHVFQTPAPPRLRIEVPHGRVRVTAAEVSETRIELAAPRGDGAALSWIAEAEVAEVGGEIVVRNHHRGFLGMLNCGPIEVTVQTPLGASGAFSTGAGRIETAGKLGDISVNTGAGSIQVEACAAARVRTGSGEIDVITASGMVDAKTGAGKVRIGKAGADVRITTGAGSARLGEITGAAHMTTGHGNIEIGRAGESVEVFTASGNIDVGRTDGGRVRAKTVSGRVSVGVANGVAALLDLSTMSGRVRTDLEASGPPAPGEPHVELILSTVSGNVTVERAA
ncbi:MAG TPA: DUF4097 family beta strand repeat-containing protein [Caulobacteraceae bacterium]|nr:DUF4097 family beta strand repeat-containing protein [Caulobacteraceae bacterium]